MQPSDLSLPSKFSSFRPGQLQALDTLKKTQARWVILQAPTGSGKSLVAAATQRMLNTRMLYVVKTKQLQDQILEDFPYAQVLKGRANYPTYLRDDKFPLINASLCTKNKEQHCRWCCTGEDAEETSCTAYRECPYYMAKQRVLATKELGVLNISLFLTEANFVGGFSGWPWVVFDEADTLESSLMNFIEFRVPKRLISLLHIPPPERKTVESSWVQWAREVVKPALETRLEHTKTDWSVANLKEEEELSRMLGRLEFFLSDVEQNPWVYTPSDEYVLKPVFVAKHAEHYLWRHGERFLLMSATIISPQQLCRDLGIPHSETEFIDLASEFPAYRRPVYYSPVVSMTFKNKSFAYPLMLKGIDSALERYPKQKVLIHTVSGNLANFIAMNSKYKARIVAYGNGVSREKALQVFTQSTEPKVLVSQSFERGIDLPDNLCRVILIAKLPFADLSDKQVAKRLYSSRDGKSWYQTMTWRNLVQMSGRGMRHKSDWVITEILDSEFENFYRKTKRLAPKWWQESLQGIK